MRDWRNENDWWKAPVLQGPENDYGDYDYLINDLPESTSEWDSPRWARRCDCCGRDRRITHTDTVYFYTLDGYDSMSDTECLVCMVKGWFRSKFRYIRRKYFPTKKERERKALEALRKRYE